MTATPRLVDRATFQSELDALRVREKAHTREGDAIAAARRRLARGGVVWWKEVHLPHIVAAGRQPAADQEVRQHRLGVRRL